MNLVPKAWHPYAMGEVDDINEKDPLTVPTGIPLLEQKGALVALNADAPDQQINEVVIISGLSGAGRSQAARVLEDQDWYVVDNLPPPMLPALVGMMSPGNGVGVHRLAVVVDVRTRSFFRDLLDTLATLHSRGTYYRIVFLEAKESTLVRRYESNRRPHPLQQDGTLLEGIRREAKLLEPLRAQADEIIDTTDMSVHDLSHHIRDLMTAEKDLPLQLIIESFGFKYGLPLDADQIIDVRFLKNPYWIGELRHLTGQDQAVADYVLEQENVRDFVNGYVDLFSPMFERYLSELKSFVTIGVGCTGGRHRSVAVSEYMAARFKEQGFPVQVVHRDVGRS